MYIPTKSGLLDAEKILQKIDIKANNIVADLGCGTSGNFVFAAAKMVGDEGKVYGVDILKSALSSVESKAKMQNFKNVETIWADIEMEGGVEIDDESCDAVFLINVHAKPGMIKEALRILKKSGKLLIIDWKAVATPFGPELESRISVEEMKKRLKEFNLNLEEEFDAGPYHWALLYKK